MMSDTQDINTWSIIILIIMTFLFYRTAILSNDLQDIPKELIISEQTRIKETLCEFKLSSLNNSKYYKIKESCNKYKIGDKLIITKDLK